MAKKKKTKTNVMKALSVSPRNSTSPAKVRRHQSNTERNKLLNQYCSALEINKISPSGGLIYDHMVRLYDTGRKDEIFISAQKHALYAKAVTESKERASAGQISTKPISLREQNARRAAEAHRIAMSGLDSKKKLTFGAELPKASMSNTTHTKTKLQNVRAGRVQPVAPLPSVSSGLTQATETVRVQFTPEAMRAAMVKMIPSAHHRAFTLYVHRHANKDSTPMGLVGDFLEENSIRGLDERPDKTVQSVTKPPEEAIETAEIVSIPVQKAPEVVFTIHVDSTDYSAAALNTPRIANMRDAGAQAAFSDAVFTNCRGKCVVSGLMFQPALQAAHITPHAKGGKMQVSNGLLLDAGLHRALDTGHMAINPRTMLVHFSKMAQETGYAHLEGNKVDTLLPLDAAALAQRWDAFCAVHMFNNK